VASGQWPVASCLMFKAPAYRGLFYWLDIHWARSKGAADCPSATDLCLYAS
jgi:hypothetical protein